MSTNTQNKYVVFLNKTNFFDEDNIFIQTFLQSCLDNLEDEDIKFLFVSIGICNFVLNLIFLFIIFSVLFVGLIMDENIITDLYSTRGCHFLAFLTIVFLGIISYVLEILLVTYLSQIRTFLYEKSTAIKQSKNIFIKFFSPKIYAYIRVFLSFSFLCFIGYMIAAIIPSSG